MKKYALEYAVAEIDSRQEEHRPRLLWALVTGFIFWVGLIGIILWLGVGFVSAEPLPAALQDDPMVMKIYPDGTKVVVRWSDVGKQLDNGENTEVPLGLWLMIPLRTVSFQSANPPLGQALPPQPMPPPWARDPW